MPMVALLFSPSVKAGWVEQDHQIDLKTSCDATLPCPGHRQEPPATSLPLPTVRPGFEASDPPHLEHEVFTLSLYFTARAKTGAAYRFAVEHTCELRFAATPIVDSCMLANLLFGGTGARMRPARKCDSCAGRV